MFSRLMARVGIGSAQVNAEFFNREFRPGCQVEGRVVVNGGKVDQSIDSIVLHLRARISVEAEDIQTWEEVTFDRFLVGQGLQVNAGGQLFVPFKLQLPWECPLTTFGHNDSQVEVWFQTDAEILGAVNPGDKDWIRVQPSATQSLVLESLESLGYRMLKTDLEMGTLASSNLPFFQEIEFVPADSYHAGIEEIEVSFVSSAVDPSTWTHICELSTTYRFVATWLLLVAVTALSNHWPDIY